MTSKVLIVDDDPTIRATLVDVLEFGGYGVCAAADGWEALDIIESCRPGLILLDLMMPRINGWEFVSQLRQRRAATIPILLMSASDRANEAGILLAQGFIAKPFDIDTVMEQVGRFVQPESGVGDARTQ